MIELAEHKKKEETKSAVLVNEPKEEAKKLEEQEIKKPEVVPEINKKAEEKKELLPKKSLPNANQKKMGLRSPNQTKDKSLNNSSSLLAGPEARDKLIQEKE